MLSKSEDGEPREREFPDKRHTRLIIHRAPTSRPGDPSLNFFGGLPRLPPSLEWPNVPRREEDGEGDVRVVPNFIAQIDLSTLPSFNGRKLLPENGTIFFFCNTQFVDVGDPSC